MKNGVFSKSITPSEELSDSIASVAVLSSLTVAGAGKELLESLSDGTSDSSDLSLSSESDDTVCMYATAMNPSPSSPSVLSSAS